MENNKNPNIRFKGFTDPWEQRKLGELSSSFEYGLNAAAKEYDGENKYIRITDIDDESREFKQEDITSPDTDLSSAENYKLSEGDILFARTGASVGKSYIYKASDGLVYYAGFLIRARIKPEYNSKFVFQNTLTGNYEKFIKVTSMRSGQPGVNAQEYSQYQIMMPSKLEQDKISDCLRNLDNLITLHQRKYNKLLNVKKSMLEKMFPKNGSNIPEIRFKGFTDPWEQRKAKNLFVSTADKGHPELPVLSATQDRGMIRRDENSINIYHDKKNEEGYKRVLPGQFVIHLRSFQGGFAHSAIEGITSPAYTVFGFSEPEKHNPNYWKYVFTSKEFIRRLETVTYGIRDGRSISYDEFLTMDFVYPPQDEQTKIANYLDTLDNLITLHQRELEKLQNIKKSMLEKMFV